VSEWTFEYAIICDIDRGNRFKRKTPWLLLKQKAAHLKFAEKHLHSFEEWIHVGFGGQMK
jgi:hypothetical protein